MIQAANNFSEEYKKNEAEKVNLSQLAEKEIEGSNSEEDTHKVLASVISRYGNYCDGLTLDFLQKFNAKAKEPEAKAERDIMDELLLNFSQDIQSPNLLDGGLSKLNDYDNLARVVKQLKDNDKTLNITMKNREDFIPMWMKGNLILSKGPIVEKCPADNAEQPESEKSSTPSPA